MPNKMRMAVAVIAGVAMWCGARASDAVSRTSTDYGTFRDIFYQTGARDRCGVTLRLQMFRKKPAFGSQRILYIQTDWSTQPGGCPLGDQMTKFASLLAAMRRDAYEPRTFDMLMLGAPYPVWQARIIDCYVNRFGGNDRRIRVFDFEALYGGCDIYRELNAELAPYGVRAQPQSEEKASDDIDFAKLSARDTNWFGAQWVAGHRHYRGKAPTGAWMNYLALVPRHETVTRDGPPD